MLPPKFKIKKALFPIILAKGKVYHSPHLMARVYKKETKDGCAPHALVSVSASKKISKLATERNHLRRRGYAALETLIEKTNPCFLCAFSFRQGALTASTQDLQAEIAALFKKAGIMD